MIPLPVTFLGSTITPRYRCTHHRDPRLNLGCATPHPGFRCVQVVERVEGPQSSVCMRWKGVCTEEMCAGVSGGKEGSWKK